VPSWPIARLRLLFVGSRSSLRSKDFLLKVFGLSQNICIFQTDGNDLIFCRF
jgi:hypothetical protein